MVEHQEKLYQVIQINIARAQEWQEKYYNSRRGAVKFNVGEHVWAFPQSRAEDPHIAKLVPKRKGSALIKK
ncbi:piezo-type mechanosensitive ion channel component 2-like, partial [Clarias magur]